MVDMLTNQVHGTIQINGHKHSLFIRKADRNMRYYKQPEKARQLDTQWGHRYFIRRTQPFNHLQADALLSSDYTPSHT
jgi:hypothetical protein